MNSDLQNLRGNQSRRQNVGSMDILVQALDVHEGRDDDDKIQRPYKEPYKEPMKVAYSGHAQNATCVVRSLVTCKARGMPLDHTGESAILLYPKQVVTHGEDLRCSHPACQRDGIKFRFCVPCQKAVAKRNFRKRHTHPNSEMNNPLHHHSLRRVKSKLSDHSETRSEEEEEHINHHDNHHYLHHQNRNSTKVLENEVPQSWIDLYKHRPRGDNAAELHSWLARVIAESGTLDTREEEVSTTSISSRDGMSVGGDGYDHVVSSSSEGRIPSSPSTSVDTAGGSEENETYDDYHHPKLNRCYPISSQSSV